MSRVDWPPVPLPVLDPSAQGLGGRYYKHFTLLDWFATSFANNEKGSLTSRPDYSDSRVSPSVDLFINSIFQAGQHVNSSRSLQYTTRSGDPQQHYLMHPCNSKSCTTKMSVRLCVCVTTGLQPGLATTYIEFWVHPTRPKSEFCFLLWVLQYPLVAKVTLVSEIPPMVTLTILPNYWRHI
jgi:hypothetical protein